MCIHTEDLASRTYSKYLLRVKSVHGAFCIICVYTWGTSVHGLFRNICLE